jgi:DNA-binding protein H-NS
MDYLMNNENKEKLETTNRRTWSVMKRFNELGHESLTTDELLQVIIELFDILLSKEDQTRQMKEKTIKLLSTSLGYGAEFTGYGSIRKPKVVPKYKNPLNPDETWTGRGNKPMWVQNHLNSGGKKEDLKI